METHRGPFRTEAEELVNLNEQIEHYKAVKLRISNAPAFQNPTFSYAPANRPLSDQRKEILKLCCEEFGTSTEEILGNSRFQNIKKARWKAAWLLHQRGGMSIAGIGRYLNKDHSSILHALKKYDGGMK